MTTVTDNLGEGAVSARMQALLSRAVEEQVSEQRQAAGTLAELRAVLAALEDSVRGAASNDAVERLDSTVSTVVADLRTSTTLLSQRLEVLSQRVDASVAGTTAPLEQTSVRLGALAAEVTAQAETVDRMRAALDLMASFPAALAALQRDVAGLHDRLAPLGDVQSAVGDLAARTSTVLDGLRPQLEALEATVSALGSIPTADRLRDAVVDSLGTRLDRLQQAAERPVVGPEVLRSGLGDLRAALVAAVGEATDPLATGLFALESRLGQLEARLAVLDDLVAAGRQEGQGLAALEGRVSEITSLRAQLDAVAAAVTALRSDTSGTAVRAQLEALSADVAALTERAGQPSALPVDDLSAHVSQRVADRLVEVLAPRISDVVLTRVSAALVTQLGEALAPRLRAETDGVLRAHSAESEKRILAHLDESVLALAEALLRRKGVRRPMPAAGSPAEAAPAAAVEAPSLREPVQDILDRLAADEPLVEETLHAVPAEVASPALEAMQEAHFPEIQAAAAAEDPIEAEAPADTRPAVTTGLAPAPVGQGGVSQPAAAPTARVAKAPAAKAAAKAPAKRPTKTAAKAPAKNGGPAKKAAPAPRKAAAKPRPRPFLEPSPDLDDHDVTPVRNGTRPPVAPAARTGRPVPPAGRPVPPAGRPVPPAARPAPPAPSPFPAPAAPQFPMTPPTVVPPKGREKRKAWWRPGG